MKKLIITSLCTLGALAAFGQGKLTFESNVTPTQDRHPVFAPQTESPTVMVVGQATLGSPSGTTVYDGGLVGSGYDFALFAGPTGTASNLLDLITTVAFKSGTGGALPQGTIATTATVINTVPGGNTADFQLRAWNTEGGTITDWATALQHFNAQDPLMQIGWTPIITSAPLGGGVTSTPNTIGWNSFSLITNPPTAPEPATIALGGLGMLGLLFFRRRK